MNDKDYEAIAASAGDCILCGGPPFVLATFVPEDPAPYTNLKEVDGKKPTFWYTLCEPCHTAPTGTTQRVEQVLRERKIAEAN